MGEGPDADPALLERKGLVRLGQSFQVHGQDAAGMLARQLVSLLSQQARSDLRGICAQAEGLAVSALSDGTLAELEQTMRQLVEFDQARGRLFIAHPALRLCLGEVCSALMASSGGDGQVAPAVHFIRQALLVDRFDDALAAFKRGGGVFFAHLHGVEAARRIVSSFPETIRQGHEQLLLADVIATVKSGDIGHARHMLISHYGQGIADLEQVFAMPGLSHDFLCCRLVVATNDDETMSDRVLSGIFHVIRALPDRAPVRKGMLYNVALDVFYRRRRWATAEDIGRRARHQFSNAGARLAAFYIDLYFALIALARGQVGRAQAVLGDARSALPPEACPSASDLGLLSALERICLYESGDAEPLALLLMGGDGELLFDDAWPSVAWPVIGIGSLAIARHATLSAARAYIDRWRSQQWQSHRFANILTLAEVEVLQMHGRWHEADELLQDFLAGGIAQGLARLLPELAETGDTATIATAMRCLRSLIEHGRLDEQIAPALDVLLANERLTIRERATMLVWKARVALDAGRWDDMRLAVTELASLAVMTPLEALFAEQRLVLGSLCSNRQAMTRLAGGSRAGVFLRTLRSQLARDAAPDEARGRAMGLTRQETRMAALLAEGVSNKLIARRLGLSLPTVRFHLRNLYRKLGAHSRREAIGLVAAAAEPGASRQAISEAIEPIPVRG